MSLEANGFDLLALDYFNLNIDRKQGSQIFLGGHFKGGRVCLKVMESAESKALVPATRKKYAPATGPQYYRIWEATNGMSNKQQSDPTEYMAGGLHHTRTDIKDVEAILKRSPKFKVAAINQELH
ncbi:hypothetical protein PGTUg99_006317 [Puccinia graminis f. sp. tritici]|uniref:Uncharacterized protein n=1 Tax=Puccinia graminis f. sp. tritici TaxID=56615 RepID=A0A5B0S3U1_PUCGR|nr:hypothetical protein PGTUg99_006317 [Puccinia graminis f. sp. tritici]